MENTTSLKLQPTVTQTWSRDTEFDPCASAKPCSPFYLYKHDSPRPSTDARPTKMSPNVSLRDLEAASDTLTPTITEDKTYINPAPTTKLGAIKARFMPSKCQQMTRAKKQGWLKRMPKKQRRMVKALIALAVVVCMVGIALGIAAGLKSTVWKGNNQQGDIHT